MKCLPSTDVELETQHLSISDECSDRPLLDHSACQIITSQKEEREKKIVA
jgi:hypothetical protein